MSSQLKHQKNWFLRHHALYQKIGRHPIFGYSGAVGFLEFDKEAEQLISFYNHKLIAVRH